MSHTPRCRNPKINFYSQGQRETFSECSGSKLHGAGQAHHQRRGKVKPSGEEVILTRIQYARYLQQTNKSNIPASWSVQKLNAHANGYSNGHYNGYANGSNGYSNSHANGYKTNSPELKKTFLEGKSVRTVYGLVPLKFALDWPVFASYDELSGCAAWMGGRIPTVEEVRSIYSHVDGLRKKEAEQHLGKTVPAVNGYALLLDTF